MSSIEVNNISKVYGKNVALNEVSFTVEKGHIYGLLGPNGAGKSTTMNIITGYIAPTSGSVSINGYVMGKDTLKAKQCIGYLPEIPPLYPDMSVYEYLDFVAKLKKVKKENRVTEIESVMEKTGLLDVERRLIKNLSKGYKQRVGIAQAIMGSPEIVILDEPTVGLDPEQIIEIRDLIKSLGNEHTVILSSHILSEISAVCDDCLVIAHGKVVAYDTTENLVKMTNKGQTIDITVKGDKDKVSDVLSKIKCIENFDFVSEADGKCVFEIEAKADAKDIREDISFALSDERILILELTEKKNTLEDTYLQLVKENEESVSIEADSEDISENNENKEDEE